MLCPAMSLTSTVMAALSCCVSVHLWIAPLFNEKPEKNHGSMMRRLEKYRPQFASRVALMKQRRSSTISMEGSLEVSGDFQSSFMAVLRPSSNNISLNQDVL